LKLRYQDLSEKLKEKEKQIQSLKSTYKQSPSEQSLQSDKDRELFQLKQELDALRRENQQLKAGSNSRNKIHDSDLHLQEHSSSKIVRAANHDTYDYHGDPSSTTQTTGVIGQFFQEQDFAAPGSSLR